MGSRQEDADHESRSSLPPAKRVAALLATLDLARRAVESHAELGTAELRLLWLFSDDRPRTQREISQDLDLEQSTVNRQVNGAIRSGLLERIEAGGPAHRFAATVEGRRRYDADVAAIMDTYDEALADVPDAEQFLDAFTTFVDAYRARVRPQ